MFYAATEYDAKKYGYMKISISISMISFALSWAVS